jgi:hypothetical protein
MLLMPMPLRWKIKAQHLSAYVARFYPPIGQSTAKPVTYERVNHTDTISRSMWHCFFFVLYDSAQISCAFADSSIANSLLRFTSYLQ